MKRNVIVVMVLFCAWMVMPLSAFAANYVKPEVFKQWLESKKQVIIVDIQPADDFEGNHFKGALETNAFPAKSEEDKKKLNSALALIKAKKGDGVIACPRGKSGAANTYDYLKSQGVAENRLFILEGGIAGWPYPELFVKGR